MFTSIHSISARSATDFSDIETFMDGFIQKKMDEDNIPNLTVSLVADGDVVFAKGYGFANINEQTEVNPETTMFRLGSVSKLFTWTAIMQLVEQGKLDLHTDINQYLDFDIPATLVVGANKEQPNPITLFHLMTHTPGFEDYSSSIYKLSAEEMPTLEQYVKEYLPERVYPPGEVIAYSNYGTALAGYIVEKVSGIPYSEYIKENIFNPLEMNYSTFQQPLPKDLSTNLAQSYRWIGGEYKEGSFEYVPSAAGSMSSSAMDMAKFMQMYLEGGSFNDIKILDDATVQEMFQQQFTAHPTLDGMTLGFMEMTMNDRKILNHNGNTTLFDAGLYLLPDENVGLFISYSGSNFLTHKELFQAFMDHYFPSDKSVTVTPMKSGDSSKFVGEYQQNRRSFTDPDKFLSLTMGKVLVQKDDSGDLLVTINGNTNRFVEVEPFIYKNMREEMSYDAYGEFNTIVFQTDQFGNIMLTTDGPMSYSKAPWYASSGFTFLSLILVILTFVGSLLFWGIKALVRRKRKTSQPKIEVFGKRMAITAGILLLFLLASIIVTGAPDPLYQLPKVAMGIEPAWSLIVNVIPILLMMSALAMLIYVVYLWSKKYCSIIQRIHFTWLVLMNMHLIWIFWYWQLF